MDDYFRQLRLIKEASGLSHTASAIADAQRASRSLSQVIGHNRRSEIERIARGIEHGTGRGIGIDDGIASALREHRAFSKRLSAGLGSDVAATAAAVARQHAERMGSFNDRILQDYLNVGTLGSSLRHTRQAVAGATGLQIEAGAFARAQHLSSPHRVVRIDS